ncbi:hypothetical protein [Streptomyces sp. NPDC002156]
MVGPFQSFPIGDNASADLYLLRYGKDGLLRSPAAEAAVKESLAEVTDVYFFAHGWNNVFAAALDRYQSFIDGYIAQGAEYSVASPGSGDYNPLLVGAIWPSTSFVMPWEEGPAIAGWPGRDSPAAVELEELLTLATSELNADEDRAFVDAVDGRTAVDPDTARELATIFLRSMRSTPDPDDGSAPPSVDDLLEIWSRLGGVNGGAGSAAAAAGQDIDLRGVGRAASVWKMKARAGAVGTRGVAPLLEHILQPERGIRLHLIGHSFGARVVLSALNAVAGRKAHALLLLQPAVNRWCLAPRVEGNGLPGGYHSVLSKVEQPILTTFSSRDWPLTKVFHLAMKGRHLGEQQPQIAMVGDTDTFGALGGYGPAGLDGQAITCNAAPPGESYPLSGAAQVIAIQGGEEVDGQVPITGHGDISNPFTWWALHELTRGD